MGRSVTVSRPCASRTTMRAVPLPLTIGTLSRLNGPSATS